MNKTQESIKMLKEIGDIIDCLTADKDLIFKRMGHEASRAAKLDVKVEDLTAENEKFIKSFAGCSTCKDQYEAEINKLKELETKAIDGCVRYRDKLKVKNDYLDIILRNIKNGAVTTHWIEQFIEQALKGKDADSRENED